MNNFEDILNNALDQLADGQPISVVLGAFPEVAAQLQPLLEVAAIGFAVPKNIAPMPMRRQLFAEEKQSWYEHFAGVMKLGLVPLALALVIVGAQNIIQQVNASPASSRLFSLKRATEQLQVSLTIDTNKKAALQLDLTQKRLDELKLAVASKDPNQETAALSALKDQVQTTFPTVAPLAAANAVAKNPALLNSLVSINKQQKEILNTIQPQPQTQSLASNARDTANQNSKALASIIATVHEQTLVDLQNKISITGNATFNNDKSKITVDSNTFSISSDTSITSSDGSTISVTDLQNNSKVTVVGTKVDSTFVAKIITVIDEPLAPPTAITKPTETPAKKVELHPAPNVTPEAPANAPNTLKGGAMFDTPEKQYAP